MRPTNPVIPPKDPETPTSPDDPETPIDPDDPDDETANPDDPDDFDDPEDPAYPAEPNDPESPVNPDNPGDAGDSDTSEGLGDSKPDFSTNISDREDPSDGAPSANPITPAKLSGESARLSSMTQLEAEKAANDLGATFADTGDDVKAVFPIVGALTAICGLGLACLAIRGIYGKKRKGGIG